VLLSERVDEEDPRWRQCSEDHGGSRLGNKEPVRMEKKSQETMPVVEKSPFTIKKLNKTHEFMVSELYSVLLSFFRTF
jgi:hypothetical protein